MTKFIDLLYQPEFIKTAGPDNPGQQQLESDFGKLAFTFLRDRADQLVPHMLGFEIVEQEDDGSKAVGMFGFKIGDGYFYVPVFFLNGQIKGMDMIYNKDYNTFMPLQQAVISELLAKHDVKLGKKVDDPNKLRQDFENPNFWFLRQPYSMAKNSSAPATCHEINKDIINTWPLVCDRLIESFEKDPGMKVAMAGAEWKLQKHRTYEVLKQADENTLVKFMQYHVGPKAVDTLATTLGNVKFASAAVAFYPDLSDLLVREFFTKKAASEKVRVITRDNDGCCCCPAMSESDKSKIVEREFAIEDMRSPDEKAEVFPVEYTKRFSAPSRPGKYHIVLRSGGTANVWVFMPNKPNGQNLLIVDPKTLTAITAEGGTVFARDDMDEDNGKPYEKAIELEDMKPGHAYVLIDEKLTVSDPFTLRSAVIPADKSEARPVFQVHFDGMYADIRRERQQPTWSPNEHDVCSKRHVDNIEQSDFEGDKLGVTGDRVIAPKNYKALEINLGGYSPDLSDSDQADVTAARKWLVPGGLLDIDVGLAKRACHKVVVENEAYRNGGQSYFIFVDNVPANQEAVNFKTAAIHMIGEFGMDYGDVEEMLKEADEKIKSRRLIKFGQHVGVSIPQFVPQPYGADEYTGAVETYPDAQTNVGQFTNVPMLKDPALKGINYGGDTSATQAAGGSQGKGNAPGMKDDVISLAQQAAESGQKTVFDHAAILGLSRVYDVSHVIDTYVPEMMKALDRLGRILFLFHWKNKDFAERYGMEDMAAMEDLLRSVFKSFGDLIMKLRQKAISEAMNPVFGG